MVSNRTGYASSILFTRRRVATHRAFATNTPSQPDENKRLESLILCATVTTEHNKSEEAGKAQPEPPEARLERIYEDLFFVFNYLGRFQNEEDAVEYLRVWCFVYILHELRSLMFDRISSVLKLSRIRTCIKHGRRLWLSSAVSSTTHTKYHIQHPYELINLKYSQSWGLSLLFMTCICGIEPISRHGKNGLFSGIERIRYF